MAALAQAVGTQNPKCQQRGNQREEGLARPTCSGELNITAALRPPGGDRGDRAEAPPGAEQSHLGHQQARFGAKPEITQPEQRLGLMLVNTSRKLHESCATS